MTPITVDERKPQAQHQAEHQAQRQIHLQALKRARTRMAWMLSTTVVVVHLAIIVLIAITPGAHDTSGANTTFIGVVLGVGVIAMGFIVTGIYVYYANRVLEPLTRAVESDQES